MRKTLYRQRNVLDFAKLYKSHSNKEAEEDEA